MTITEMTTNALNAAAQNYGNEEFGGGEGYNPYSAELDRRQSERMAKSPRTATDVRSDISRIDCSMARESGTYDADKVAALEKELAELSGAKNGAKTSDDAEKILADAETVWVAACEKGSKFYSTSYSSADARKNKAERDEARKVVTEARRVFAASATR